MATHSSILAWAIPWTEEPGGLQSMGSQRVRHDGGTNTSTTWLLAPGSGMIMPRNIVLPPTLRATWRRRDFEWLSLQIKNSL